MEQDYPDNLRQLKHDIRNQLSNIQLAVEQLRYEMPADAPADQLLYIDMIAESCIRINALIRDRDQ